MCGVLRHADSDQNPIEYPQRPAAMLQGWREQLAAATQGCVDSISLALGPQISQWG